MSPPTEQEIAKLVEIASKNRVASEILTKLLAERRELLDSRAQMNYMHDIEESF